MACVQTLYEHAGGDAALHRAEEIFYDKVLGDPVLKAEVPSAKRNPRQASAPGVIARTVGGPDRLAATTRLPVHHRCAPPPEDRRRTARAVRGPYLEAVDEAGLPTDEQFRDAVRSHLEFGSRVHSKTPGRTPTTSFTRSVPSPTGAGRTEQGVSCLIDREPCGRPPASGCPLIEIRRIRAVIPISGHCGRTPDCGYDLVVDIRQIEQELATAGAQELLTN